MIRSKTRAALSSIFSPKIPAYDWKENMRILGRIHSGKKWHVTNRGSGFQFPETRMQALCKIFSNFFTFRILCYIKFSILPMGKETQSNSLGMPCLPPPPHLGLNSELCIVPSYVANDAENSALRFIKVGFHMLEKSWTIIVQDFSNICGNPV